MDRREFLELVAEKSSRYDYIIDTYECREFTEITGSIGGDIERMRIYKNGTVGIK